MSSAINDLIDEYSMQVKVINRKLKELCRCGEPSYSDKIRILRAMKKDLNYSISLMEKHR